MGTTGETFDDHEITRRRLGTQRLVGTPFSSPAEAVEGLLAVQSQEYLMARWALGMRCGDCDEAAVEQAFAAGEILRTHVLRPTWHFVAPADIRWLLELTAPRVLRLMTPYERELELDEALLDRCLETIAEALRGGLALTRAELGEALAQAGVADASGRRLGHIAMRAELEGLVCSGPRAGKRHTYMLLDERAPEPGPAPSGSEALAELALRFFTGHGPATAHDLAKWSSLRVRDARTGIELAGDGLQGFEHDGKTWWHAGAGTGAESHGCLLLPDYDEAAASYRDLRLVMGAPVPGDAAFQKPLLLDGECVGTWNRSLGRESVDIEVRLFRQVGRAGRAEIEAEADRFASFLQLRIGFLQWVVS